MFSDWFQDDADDKDGFTSQDQQGVFPHSFSDPAGHEPAAALVDDDDQDRASLASDGDDDLDSPTGLDPDSIAADHLGHLPHFDPAAADPATLIGDPGGAMEHWHFQAGSDTCAVASQEFVLQELTGLDWSEDDLRQEAIDNGWYVPGGGTPLYHTGQLIEAHGFDVEQTFGATLDDLAGQLAQGHEVLVAVDADEIWTAGQNKMLDDLLSDTEGIPGQDANHAVQVIGIDRSDPGRPMVILNDPGHPNGRGLMVPAGEFLDAWQDSGQFMVHTTGLPVAPLAPGHEAGPRLGGYYNADGTYHWDSDNTDRDPETGAVVRRW